jgi:uncharacterized membrane protein YeiH
MSWTLFEIIGVISFAYSGAVVGLTRRMDIFGICVLSVLTALGGGIIRDILAGVIPPSALVQPYNFILSIATACVVCFLFETVKISRQRRKMVVWVYNVADALGLASFTVTGAATGLMLYPDAPIILPVMMGLCPAVGGGILRDVLARRVPVVLKADVYAIASIAGGLAMGWLWTITGSQLTSWIAFILVLGIRICAIRFHWQLHHPKPSHIMFHL